MKRRAALSKSDPRQDSADSRLRRLEGSKAPSTPWGAKLRIALVTKAMLKSPRPDRSASRIDLIWCCWAADIATQEIKGGFISTTSALGISAASESLAWISHS